MQKNKEAEVLNSIYRGAKTGSQAISDLLPKAENSRFRSDLQTQEQEYNTISNEAANMLIKMGAEPEPVSAVKKMGMKMGVETNTMINNDTGYLANLMIKGSTMGITNMTKVLNNYKDPDPQITDLASRLIKAEQQNIDRLKAYLH